MDNNAKTQYIITDVQERIVREEDLIGVGTPSAIQNRLDHVDTCMEAYNPSIKGIDAKVIGIGQSINKIKDEIITLYTNAVMTGNSATSCGTYNAGAGCSFVDASEFQAAGGFSGWGLSTCFTGYGQKNYDVVTAHIWPFDPTTDDPFTPATTEVINTASTTYTAGVGTFISHTPDGGGVVGNTVTLNSNSGCSATATEITRKEAEITALRSELDDYRGIVNDIRTDRLDYQLEEWGSKNAIEEAKAKKERLSGILTAFSDSRYNSLFLKT